MSAMQSKAETVEAYLDELPPERREMVSAVRELVNRAIQPGFEERMQYGMIVWCVPLSAYPKGYHCDPKLPVSYMGLASQKQAVSLYLNFMYGSEHLLAQFEADYEQAGKKLNMGKSCLRFKKIDDLALDVLERHIHAVTLEQYIAGYAAVDPRNKKK